MQTQSLAVFAEGRAPTKNTWDIECAGSGAQEPDSTRNLMTRGRDERPRAENHGFDLPCTRFYHFCKPETLCLSRMKQVRLQKYSVFEGSKWKSKKRETHRV